MTRYDLKNAVHSCQSVSIIIAVSFCVAGIGLFMHSYYSGYQEQQLAMNLNQQTQSTIRDTTVYHATNNLISDPTNLPLKMKIMGAEDYQKNSVSYDVSQLSWVPLLIVGIYILVHARNGIESKANL